MINSSAPKITNTVVSRTFATSLLTILVLVSLVSCASVSRALRLFEDPARSAAAREVEVPVAYRTGLAELEKGDFEGAFHSFNNVLHKHPTSRFTQVALFNSGRALEGMNQWVQAAERYRTVVKNTAGGRAPKLEALALYRLSFTYEARGDDAQVIASLNDVLARAAYLPDETGSAELPARLASAYARIGNHDMAQEFYDRAESGIMALKQRQGEKKVPEWLPRTLFYMGRVTVGELTGSDIDTYLRPLETSQLYLLQAAELGDGVWSKKAAEELTGTYRELWRILEGTPQAEGDDAVLSRREAQRRQLDLAVGLQESLRILRAYKLPLERQQTPDVREIYACADEIGGKISGLLQEPPAGSGLTPAARKRLEKVRGRVIDPDTRLENRFLSDPPPSPKPPSPKPPSPKPSAPRPEEDPNL